ncbi:MAG: methyltransferase domain-containing protein [Anaerolineales bacterium]|nr:methyltransferase domain-containing protein [Anaerolineales bacterium]
MNAHKSQLARLDERYRIQAEWTAPLRSTILDRIGLTAPADVLEVGSGTGAITRSISERIAGNVFGLDIDRAAVAYSRGVGGAVQCTVADGHDLPFADDSFDVVFSHFLMLWVADPARILSEMVRVAKTGAWVIAFAEPDYGSRIDFPLTVEEIGVLQAGALQRAGADIRIGRRLRALFSEAGLTSITAGVLGGEWQSGLDERLTRSEWETLKSDLARTISPEKIKRLKEADRTAWRDETRVLFVPTFYAYGQVR